jgi:predicted ferric reductase
VHIQAVGNWTKQVYKRFKHMSENNEGHVKVYRGDLNPERAAVDERNENNIDDVATASIKKEIVIIDGPYSSCTRQIFDCRHTVLICGGIGVTPYASILSSLMVQFRASRTVCQQHQDMNNDQGISLENCRIKKVDFIWVTRDHKSFEWFLNLLQRFEEEQESYLALVPGQQRFLTIHLYFTEISTNEHMKHFPLQLISQVWTQVTGKDMFTDLKARTHIGRPIWDEIFTKLRSDENVSTANDASVFFCGSSVMSKIVQEHCIKYNLDFYEDKF